MSTKQIKKDFPYCAKNCEAIKELGAGECENVCPMKFAKPSMDREELIEILSEFRILSEKGKCIVVKGGTKEGIENGIGKDALEPLADFILSHFPDRVCPICDGISDKKVKEMPCPKCGRGTLLQKEVCPVCKGIKKRGEFSRGLMCARCSGTGKVPEPKKDVCPEQLHQWYLEATEKLHPGDKFEIIGNTYENPELLQEPTGKQGEIK